MRLRDGRVQHLAQVQVVVQRMISAQLVVEVLEPFLRILDERQ